MATKLITVLAVLLNLATLYFLVIEAFLIYFRLSYDDGAEDGLYIWSVLTVAVVLVTAAFASFRRRRTRNVESVTTVGGAVRVCRPRGRGATLNLPAGRSAAPS